LIKIEKFSGQVFENLLIVPS